MTVTANSSAGSAGDAGTPPVELITVTIDGTEVSVPKGTLVIRAAELMGTAIPRFCDHPLLKPAGACRQCLVEAGTPGPDGSIRWFPKPQSSCTLECSPGMVVKTQMSSPVAEKAQRGVMELLLINHPLDCPVCDKGGECPLQNQAMANGGAESRFQETKRTFPKPVAVSSEVLLDRERCVLCQRCTRFQREIAGDPFIDLQKRGSQQQIGTFDTDVLGFHNAAAVGEEPEPGAAPFSSYFSGNTVQICPVGALTSAAYRFRSRPFDLVSTDSVCEHCSSGCALRVDHRRGVVRRRQAGDDPAVNEEWSCDKGRWAFTYAAQKDRFTVPLLRGEDGALHEASWPEALEAAAAGLAAARAAGGVGVLPGGRVSVEDAYAYQKFARVTLGTNDVDFRARPHSAEEADFLAHAVAGRGLGVTYATLQAAPVVLLVGFEPEEESPIVFLRLRKAMGQGQKVFAVAPLTSEGVAKLDATTVLATPGTEPQVLAALADGAAEVQAAAEALRTPGAVVLVGERLATVPGALSAALDLADRTGAALAWVPRRAGERGAVEAGALPGLLPGGRPVADSAARVDLAAAWGVPALPERPGRDVTAMLAALAAGELAGAVVGGVDLDDLPVPSAARAALEKAAFVVSLEQRPGTVTPYADVVLPVATVSEKAGFFVDWEGRWREFGPSLDTNSLSDLRVLDALSAEIDALGDGSDTRISLRGVEAARGELAQLDDWEGTRAPAPAVAAGPAPVVGDGEAVLATWPLLIDAGRLQEGEPHLAGTARRTVAKVSAGTLATLGVEAGSPVTVRSAAGAITVPVQVADLPDQVVWLPTNSPGSAVRAVLEVPAGAVVTLVAGTGATSEAAR